MLEAMAGDNTAAIGNLGGSLDMNSDAIGMNSSDIAGLTTDVTKLEADIEALDIDSIAGMAGGAGGGSSDDSTLGATYNMINGSNPGIRHYSDAASILYAVGAGNFP